MAAERSIVVGVDGSEASRAALDWAIEEARLRGATCLLVHAYEFGVAAAGWAPGRALEQIEKDAEWVLDAAVERARAGGVPVQHRLELGAAAQVLIAASADADLLVVGTRGRGGVASTLLGSVSTACVHHAHCPVVVVPLLRMSAHAGEDREALATT